MRKEKIKKRAFNSKILMLGIIINLLVIFFQKYEYEKIKSIQIKDAGIILTNKIKAKVEVLEDITEFLKGVSVARNGEVSQELFYKVSRFLYSLYQENEISGIFYLEGGRIKYAYPIEGNRGTLGIDILQKAERKDDALLAIRKKQAVLSGPYKLYQGNIGMIIRNPIFIQRDGKEEFIGFSALAIKFPNFMNSIDFNELKDYNYKISTYSNGEKKIITSKGIVSPNAKTFVTEILNNNWEITLDPINNNLGINTMLITGIGLFLLTLILSHLFYRYEERKKLLEEMELEKELLLVALENSQIVIFTYDDVNKKIHFRNKRSFLEEYNGKEEISSEILEEKLIIEEGKEKLLKAFSQIRGGRKKVTCTVQKNSEKNGKIWEKITLLNPFVDKYGMEKIIGIVEEIKDYNEKELEKTIDKK